MINIIVRRMQDQDISQVWLLCKELNYDGDEDDVMRRFNRINKLSDHTLFVATSENEERKIYGFIHFSNFYKLGRKRSIEIHSLAVNKELRGKGIGKKLIGVTEKWAKNNDLARIKITSNEFRDEAHEFYKKLGYKAYKTSCFFEKMIEEE